MVYMTKSEEICFKFTTKALSNFYKRCSNAHFVSFLFYYSCTFFSRQNILKFKTHVLQVLNFRTICVNLCKSDKAFIIFWVNWWQNTYVDLTKNNLYLRKAIQSLISHQPFWPINGHWVIPQQFEYLFRKPTHWYWHQNLFFLTKARKLCEIQKVTKIRLER